MDEIKTIKQLLIKTGLNKRPGSLLYSANSTLKKGDWYFLGSNPGGAGGQFDDEKEDTVENHLVRKKKDFNEYTEGVWSTEEFLRRLVNMFIREELKNFSMVFP